jgi:hypothetical protein
LKILSILVFDGVDGTGENLVDMVSGVGEEQGDVDGEMAWNASTV